jgi:hypothetical protein
MGRSASGKPLMLPAAKSVKISGCEFWEAAEISALEISFGAENSAAKFLEASAEIILATSARVAEFGSAKICVCG